LTSIQASLPVNHSTIVAVAFGASARASAVMPRSSAASVLPHPSSAKSGPSFKIAESRLASIFREPSVPRFDALLSAAAQAMQRENDQQAEFKQAVDGILAKAREQEWSSRQLAGKIGISARSWARILSGQAVLEIWLAKVIAAAARLNTPAPEDNTFAPVATSART
jgi:ribosome-binding protein aMBF1 (putative translation factor)